jgi:hypothetical protein
VGEREGGAVMDGWDDLDEQDDASTWFFGGYHRKRIARRRCGASARGRRMWSLIQNGVTGR